MEYRTGEIQVRFISERINSMEKHLAELCQCFAAYTSKLARARDTGDDLAKSFLQFAQADTLNSSLQKALFELANYFGAIQDYREAQVQRLDTRVIKRLSESGAISKQAKEDLKQGFEAQSREISKKQQLDRIRGRYPTSWQQIAENELQKASSTASEVSESLEKQIDAFEQRKLEDIQQILLDFINIELLYHSKAVELFSKAFGSVAAIDPQQDMEDFRNCLRAPSLSGRSSLSHFLSAPDLSSIGGSSSTNLRPSPATLPGRHSMKPTSARSLRDQDSTDSELENDDEKIQHISPLHSAQRRVPRKSSHPLF